MKTKNLNHSTSWVCALSLLIAGTVHGEVLLSFGEFTWNQANAPDTFDFLGDGVTLGGARFSEGIPNRATHQVQFPNEAESEVKKKHAVGAAAPYQSEGIRAINLPWGDDGSVVRHGVSVSWSEGQLVPNLGGPDIVIFESGTGSQGKPGKRGPDAFMVRVRKSSNEDWTDWYYIAAESFYSYTLEKPAAGAYITVVDFEKLGVKYGDLIDTIQIANLTKTDRIDSKEANAEGKVVFGKKKGNKLARPKSKFDFFSSFQDYNNFDPDILYVAPLQDVTK